MGKVLTGIGEIGLAVGLGALAFFDPAVLAIPGYAELASSLFLAGVSSEVGAIADALSSNRGQNITTRQAAAFRQIVYGTQRIGGIKIYQSTTGSHKDQCNICIVLAGHELSAIQNIYLDGRQVYFTNGVGTSTRNGITFGGAADSNSHTGPDGTQYNFGGKVYVEARYGDQVSGDVIGGFTANDPLWAATSAGSPYVGGCAYLYVKIENDPSLFPGEPEIRITVLGKPVADPRSGQTAYSENPALIVNDILIDPVFGLGDTTVNQTQLIAAANVCDELVPTATAGNETRYTGHWHYDTQTAPGDAISTMLTAMAGKMSRINGLWSIFPGAYIAPTLSFGPQHVLSAPTWNPVRSLRDKFNRVRGVYTAPNFPFSIAGNYYDANGFNNGHIQNNFSFAFQPTNYPEYACDVSHGYASDQYLNADGGHELVKELGLNATLSVSMAQRLAKIELMRNRQEGSGTLRMPISAYQLQPTDTFFFTWPAFGWLNKILEVTSTEFVCETADGQAPQLYVEVGVQETSPAIWNWNATAEEQTVYDLPAVPAQVLTTPVAPTNLALLSGPSTAVTQTDGSVTPRIQATWDTPLDGRVTSVQLQYAASGTTGWMDGGTVDVSLNMAFISGIVAGQSYDVQIRSLRANGAYSPWEGPVTIVTSVVTSSATSSATYHPTSGTDSGAATANPSYAYDGTSSTAATVTGTFTVAGFTAQSLPQSTTLTVIASGSSGSITAKYGSTTVTVASALTGTTKTYTATIPANTILSNISVIAAGSISLAEVYIQA